MPDCQSKGSVPSFNDFSNNISKGYGKISEFLVRTLRWMPSGPSDLLTFSYCNLVSISTQSKLILGMLEKLVGSVSNK